MKNRNKLNYEEAISEALAIISPHPTRAERCRDFLELLVQRMRRAEPQLSPKKERHRLERISVYLERARKTIATLPRSRQYRLLPRQHRDPSEILLGMLGEENPEVSHFLKTLEQASQRTALHARKIKVPRSGGRPNYLKGHAAYCALALLFQFGQKNPTLTTDGHFFRLAAVLYEIATGKTDVDLISYCRKAHKDWRSSAAV
jgi:hypothetical protein